MRKLLNETRLPALGRRIRLRIRLSEPRNGSQPQTDFRRVQQQGREPDPMRKLLNTLYVTIPNAYLSKDGETVLVRVEHETRLRVPIHNLEGIVCVGLVSMSTPT